jgi:hypothetical protein
MCCNNDWHPLAQTVRPEWRARLVGLMSGVMTWCSVRRRAPFGTATSVLANILVIVFVGLPFSLALGGAIATCKCQHRR